MKYTVCVGGYGATRSRRRVKMGFFAVLFAMALPVAAETSVLPWEVWKDPGVVAEIRPDARVVLSSSVDPDGGPYDRHSEGQSRLVRTVNGEGVIFETEGAGAVTRIWMTQGDGISVNLDQNIRLRVRIDGASEPVVDLPLTDFFGGEVAPFLEPMVLDRDRSGGGNVSHVPMPFRTGCRVSLVGAERAKIWFQVTALLLDGPEGVTSFSGDEDYSEWRRILGHPGTDLWRGSPGETVSGAIVVRPGAAQQLAAFDGPDQITALVLRIPPHRMDEVVLRMTFDGVSTVDLPLPWFFGIGRPPCSSIRSLFIGVDQGEAFSFFPMPFHRRAEISVEVSAGARASLRMEYAVRRAGRSPVPDAGFFGVEAVDVPASTPGREVRLLELSGAGRIAGVALNAGSAAGGGWTFLEGDERFIVDGESGPAWRGTGVEDFFGGGFYFRNAERKPKPFWTALHGMTCVRSTEQGPALSLYRLMPTEGPHFHSGLEYLQESGSTGNEVTRWRGVAWVYRSMSQSNRGADQTDGQKLPVDQ